MKVCIDKRQVDVSRRDCGKRPCFFLGFDRGSYTPGLGYSYYADRKEYAVCWTRHLNGCPMNSICPKCRLLSVEEPGSRCEHVGCDGLTVAREATPA